MSDLFPVDPQWAKESHCDNAKYLAMYERSVKDPQGFWGDMAKRLDWITPPTRIKNTSFEGDVAIRWFEDGVLNVSYNCIDRHLPKRADQTAILWEGDDPEVDKKITYRELHEKVCKLANVLKGMGVKKGDRVTIYLPMIPEAAYAMLACARIGAPHSVVFGGFSPDSLADRVNDAASKLIITADGGLRGGRAVALKENADKALEKCAPDVKVLMFRHTGLSVPMVAGRDHDAGALMEKASPDCPPEPMNAEDPLFLLYTSGSTGKPKGALHTSGGYLRLCGPHPRIRVRLPRGRHLLVHGRCRLGHRPQLHSLWAARQRRHDPDVRGHPDLSQHLAVLGRRRQAQGQRSSTRPRRRSAR